MWDSRRKKRRQVKWIIRTVCALAIVTASAAVLAMAFLNKNENSHERSIEEEVRALADALTKETDRKDPETQETDTASAKDDEASAAVSETFQKEKEDTAEEQEITEQSGTHAEDAVSAEIEKLLGEMSLHDKICQMMLVTPETLTGVSTATAAGQTTENALSEYPVGGVILFANNLVDADQTKGMISNLQKYSTGYKGIGLFIAVDEEGGRVARVAQKLGTTQLNPMYEYRNQGVKTAYDNAAMIAGDISGFGFNLDFAPVADTWSNPNNTVIGKRAYSDNYEEAAALVSAAVEGFHSENIMCTLKHFPGHGDTEEDSHTGSAYVHKTLEELRAEELLPFQAGIHAGADMVMVGHITLPELDSLPASLSSVMITDILRGELAFDGVVITDSLSMNALTDLYGEEKIAVMAIQAGNDVLLCQSGMKTMVSALKNAVAGGEISEERIDQSVRRILKLKYEYGLLNEATD